MMASGQPGTLQKGKSHLIKEGAIRYEEDLRTDRWREQQREFMVSPLTHFGYEPKVEFCDCKNEA